MRWRGIAPARPSRSSFANGTHWSDGRVYATYNVAGRTVWLQLSYGGRRVIAVSCGGYAPPDSADRGCPPGFQLPDSVKIGTWLTAATEATPLLSHGYRPYVPTDAQVKFGYFEKTIREHGVTLGIYLQTQRGHVIYITEAKKK